MDEQRKPAVKLVGEDGNVFSIIARVSSVSGTWSETISARSSSSDSPTRSRFRRAASGSGSGAGST